MPSFALYCKLILAFIFIFTPDTYIGSKYRLSVYFICNNRYRYRPWKTHIGRPLVWRYRNEIPRPIVVPFIHDHHLMLQHDNAQPHVARICKQFLKAENISVLAWPAYSPDMSPIEHVWDALDRRIRQRVPVTANIQQLRTAIEEEWTNIPQATINNLINSMQRRCVALREANGGHTRYWLVFAPPDPPQYSKTAHFRVTFYCGQPKAHLCNNHAVKSASWYATPITAGSSPWRVAQEIMGGLGVRC